MASFQYVALDQKGKKVRGYVEAGNPKTAAKQLRSQNLYAVSIKFSKGGGGEDALQNVAFRTRNPIKLAFRFFPIVTQDRVFFFQQLALMLRSGLTLLSALEVCQKQTVKVRMRKMIERMKSTIRSGSPLSVAIINEGTMFPVIVQKLVKSAEISGQMPTILDQIATYLEYKADQKRKILSSLTYPAIVVLVTLFVAGFLVVMVIPKFASFFLSRGAQLPPSTQMLVDVSKFIVANVPFLFFGMLILVTALGFIYSTAKGKYAMHHFILNIPVVGNLLIVSALTQMTRSLSILLQSGITLFESLQSTAGVMQNLVFKGCLDKASDEILAGKELSVSMIHPMMPPLIPHMLSVGEKSGALVNVLSEMSRFYDKQLEQKTRLLVSLVEPVLILIIGGMVGFVYFSFFQAVFNLVA